MEWKINEIILAHESIYNFEKIQKERLYCLVFLLFYEKNDTL